jgi:hypothetical protein
MASLFSIGVNHAGLTTLDALSPPLMSPKAFAMDYADSKNLGDSSRQGVGWLVQVWHWDYMTVAQRNKLYTFVGDVNVVTRQNDGTYDEYTCKLVWPEKEPDSYAGRVLNVSVELRGLVAV